MDDQGTHEAGEHEQKARAVLDETPLAGGAPEQPTEGWWSDIDRRHRVLRLAAIIAGVGVLALAAGAAVTVLGPQLFGGRSGTPVVTGGTPTAGVPATSTAQPSAAATSTTTATVPATTSVPPTSTALGAAVRAPLVAYRRDGAVWVSGEEGQDPRRVIGSASGPFALSPDGRIVALVDGASKTLSLVDVASHTSLLVGLAELETPSWAPDSSFVVYTALLSQGPDTVVKRVARDGSSRSTLGSGAMPRVTPDGRVVAISGTRTASGVPVVVYSAGATRLIGGKMTANAVAASTSTVAFCDAGSPGVQSAAREPSVGVMRFDGSGRRTLVKRPLAGSSAFFGDIELSPDGKRIVYAESGDDGFSRLYVIALAGGKPLQLSTRRDAYLLGFSADGTEVLYVDGNALQGESTRLEAVRLDGSGRRVVAEGAGI